MARGYPTPRELNVDHPVLDDVLAPSVCRICKHRAATTTHGLCAECDKVLHGPLAESELERGRV